MSQQQRVMVWDFDGTVALGSGPVLAYANAVAAELAAPAARQLRDEVESALELHPSGRLPGSGAIDGYDLVRVLAAQWGTDAALLSRAYRQSRELLATPAAPIHPVPGLADVLAAARGNAVLVLATNAPDIRLDDALRQLGLDGAFDIVRHSVGKPRGMAPLLDELAGPDAGAVLSIGDVWVNDLQPVHARGGMTALIGPADPLATPSMRAETLEELFPAIADWLALPS
ncbi:FMN phosphatase YigB (HAD superfamily) [Microterricola gilva]|uniref:FMN phosphatase YigB (HAD superfamily) n=1 Tax=Microterricola gilva TaxID=393267 RepID=A0A4Q8AMG3_9MICO|nr:HAD family hydrolase [Microterricola gilva]RZU65764.1 FMN phosphatase YigB (HAD superfamily) [Microterricola gilva]